MKLTNGEIYMSKGALTKLLQERLPVKTAYALAMLAQKLDNQLAVIEKVREGLFKTYGKPVEGVPNKLWVDPNGASFPQYLKELSELMGQEIEVVYTPPTLPESLELEPATLLLLQKFVKVPK